LKKKIILTLLIVYILLIVGLSRCLNQFLEVDTDGDGYASDIDMFLDNPNEWHDLDSDGHGDNSDDYPDDSNLYKNEVIASSSWHTLKPGETYHPLGCKCLNIDCSCKCVEISWNVYGTSTEDRKLTKDEEERLYLYILLPDLTIPYNYYKFRISPILGTILINTTHSCSWGNWEIYFSNPSENPGVDMDYNIFKIM